MGRGAIGRARRRLEDVRAAVIGYKRGSGPAWEDLMEKTLRDVWAHERDEDALDAITVAVHRDPTAAERALERLREVPPSYESDRGARLLSAALDGSSVKPTDPAKEMLFEQEATIGRESVSEAFRRIAAREPELERIRGQLQDLYGRLAGGTANADARGNREIRKARLKAMHEVAGRVGPQSNHSDPLLRSFLARNVTYRILELASGNPRRFDPNARYFDDGIR
jgi:hypothetical protein